MQKLGFSGMPKHADIRGKQLIKTTNRKPLCIILTFAGTQMFLVGTVMVVAELVHENVQEHKCPCLRLREAACHAFLLQFMRDAKPLKNVLVRIEIWQVENGPKVILPRVKVDRSSFFSVEKLVGTILATAPGRQDNALQPFREPFPLGNDVDECLHVALTNYMTKPAPRRLAIQDVSFMPSRSVSIFALNAAVLDLRCGASVKRGVHGDRLRLVVSGGGPSDPRAADPESRRRLQYVY
jgi:hypothetical protein